jgi:hypothetical protein
MVLSHASCMSLNTKEEEEEEAEKIKGVALYEPVPLFTLLPLSVNYLLEGLNSNRTAMLTDLDLTLSLSLSLSISVH